MMMRRLARVLVVFSSLSIPAAAAAQPTTARPGPLSPWAAAALAHAPDTTGSIREVRKGPVAVGARVAEVAGVTRLTVDLSAKVPASTYVIEKPDRVVVELPETNFQMDPSVGRLGHAGVGVVRGFRFGLFASGRSRLVIELNGPANVRKLSVDAIAGGEPSRLTLELVRADRASFRAAARRIQQPSLPPGPPSAGAGIADVREDLKPVIVIDPGHGGIDPGANGIGGVSEKTVVLDFARALAARLEAGNRYQVLMTRADDSFISLGDRVRLARDKGAALFVSVHADTLSDGAVAGATVYTASDRASDAEAARVAETENRADEVGGVETSPDVPEVSDILFDLTRRETRGYAHLFQRTLVGYWRQISHLNKNPERSAGFRVLQAPDVPSVLLELGYLSSPQDSAMLQSPAWRMRAVTSVASAIDTFFAGRGSPGDGVASQETPASTGIDRVVSAQQHP